jgi:vanillate O-demethylase ferredoxin subunit
MSWSALHVRSLRLEAEDVLGIELAPADATPLPFTWAAGAHVDLRLGNGAVRQYSVLSLPEDGHLYLGIKREPASRGGSRWLHEQLRLGAQIDVSAPRNLFALQPGSGPVTLVAAGIGITPLLPMYRQCLAEGRPVRLLYFTRDTRQAPFMQRLGVDVQWFGGLRAGEIAELLGNQFPAWQSEAGLYCCGPVGFMDRVEQAALRADWPATALYREHFQARQPVNVEAQSFSLELRRSGCEVQVQAGESLIQAAARVGVNLEFSCGMGMCGACVCRVLDGEPEHRDECLSDAQRHSGEWIAACVSGCRSSSLVLDA